MFYVLFLAFCSTITHAMSYSTWIDGSPSLPRESAQMAIAYNNISDIVWLVGGSGANNRQLISFDPNYRNFTDYGQSYLNGDIAGAGQYYSQINNILWMINQEGTSFDIFDITSASFERNYSSIVFPQKARSTACLASINIDDGYLTVNGGQNTDGYYLNTVQILNLSSNEWLSNDGVPTMNIARGWHSCIVHHKQMYVIGGYDYFSGPTYKSSIERLDVSDLSNIQSKTWVQIGDLLKSMWGHRAIMHGHSILVFGGRSRYSYNNQINVIDTTTGNVISGGYMGHAAAFMSPIILQQRIFVFGGQGESVLNYWQYNSLHTISPTMSRLTDVPTAAPTGSAWLEYTLDTNTLFTAIETSVDDSSFVELMMGNIVVLVVVISPIPSKQLPPYTNIPSILRGGEFLYRG
eukprot:510025_1